jgi:hypothetical protein
VRDCLSIQLERFLWVKYCRIAPRTGSSLLHCTLNASATACLASSHSFVYAGSPGHSSVNFCRATKLLYSNLSSSTDQLINCLFCPAIYMYCQAGKKVVPGRQKSSASMNHLNLPTGSFIWTSCWPSGSVLAFEAEKDELKVASFWLLTTKYIYIYMRPNSDDWRKSLALCLFCAFNLSFYIFTMPRFLCGKPLADWKKSYGWRAEQIFLFLKLTE